MLGIYLLVENQLATQGLCSVDFTG